MTKKEALSIVFSCAPLYKENLVDQSLLFVTTDKLAGSLSACMGFVRDGGNGRFVPNTVLEGDIRTKVKHADCIILTYRKKRSDAQYAEIVFQAKKVEWEKIVLPEECSYLSLPESATTD